MKDIAERTKEVDIDPKGDVIFICTQTKRNPKGKEVGRIT